ncbi:fluoride efflux transporter CrcB [Rhizobiales bacterium RZME27]|uniref:Fluoride-specific ion channel FluC n=2 Tax=Endobacterium cereale TaxID=2663029 RepID=A0A6A8A7Y5_9HYPH|nr:fluoride efflux transporter CrcB [Endobacterium cereale]MEB2843371.1 fluoride efflux transporter CrcB [Endobacterium cereale]MQY47382.1 fluoride efflux transporter CrcB [Endobacterium cereale]
MNSMLVVAAGGAVGSVFRYLVGIWAVRLFGTAFPWGTLAINVVGSFVIGLLAEMIARRFGGSTEMRLLLVTGLCGGFTTFSSFSLEFVGLVERGAMPLAVSYLAASVILAIGATFFGLFVGRIAF